MIVGGVTNQSKNDGLIPVHGKLNGVLVSAGNWILVKVLCLWPQYAGVWKLVGNPSYDFTIPPPLKATRGYSLLSLPARRRRCPSPDRPGLRGRNKALLLVWWIQHFSCIKDSILSINSSAMPPGRPFLLLPWFFQFICDLGCLPLGPPPSSPQALLSEVLRRKIEMDGSSLARVEIEGEVIPPSPCDIVMEGGGGLINLKRVCLLVFG